MPPLGVLVDKHDFSEYFVTLSPGHYESVAQAKLSGAATLNYGLFVNSIINFIIIAVAIFLVVKWMNRLLRKPAEKVTPSMRDCPECLSAIPLAARRCKFCASTVEAARTPG